MSERPGFFPEIPTFTAVRPPDFIPEPLGAGQPSEGVPAGPVTTAPFAPQLSGVTPAEAVVPPSAEMPTAPERPDRITLLGRLGTEIKFKVTPKGLLVASFPLGVKDDEGQTHWETVLAFGDRAEKLRDTLTKGQTAEVIGYRKERTYKGRDGKERTVKEINSVVVKPR